MGKNPETGRTEEEKEVKIRPGERNMPGSINREDCALLVIDIQEKLFPLEYEKERLLRNAVGVVEFAKLMGIPIIVTEQENLGDTVPEIREPLGDFKPIRKICFSCFLCEEFVKALERTGKKKLILIGIETHICITQTALDAMPDYDIHLVTDAVSSIKESDREIGIERMRVAGVTITSAEMLIYEILKKVGTDEFRAALKIVKKL
jgi:nicotinamidase-related amidase